MTMKVSIIDGIEPNPGSGLGGANEGHIQGFQDDISNIQLGGVRDKPGGDCLVTEITPTPGMFVKIADGVVYVPNNDFDAEEITTTKGWRVVIKSEGNLAIAANSSGSTRIDLVCIKVDKVTTPNEFASNVATKIIVQGTPGAGAPALPAKHYKLAQVTVINGATEIENADIADSRTQIAITANIETESLKVGGSAAITDVLDEDDMSSDSATAIPTQQSVKAYVDSIAGNVAGKNLLMNGGMKVAQRGTQFTDSLPAAGGNNDDKYTLDRWNLLSDGNDIVDVTQIIGLTDPVWSMKLTAVTANKRFGIVQFIEAKDAFQLQDKIVSLSFRAKTNGTEIANLRAFVLSWTGSSDLVTSDIIASWGSAGADPTFAANWTKENNGANLALTSSFQRFTIENIPIDTAVMNNLAVFIMIDDDNAAANDDVFITDVMLNEGEQAAPFELVSFERDLAQCQRYYEKSFNYGTVPAVNVAAAEVLVACGTGNFGTSFGNFVPFKIHKHKAPSLTFFSSQSGDAGKWLAYTGGVGSAQTPTVNNIGENGFAPSFTASGLYTMAIGHYTAEAEL